MEVESRVRSVAVDITSGGGSQGVELRGGVEVSLRLHERGTVVSHDPVASIGVAAEEDDGGRDDNHEQEDERKGGVENEEDDTDNSNNQSRCAKHIGKDEDENGIEEIDDANRNVEGVGALVHPGTENGGTDERGSFDNENTDSLSNRLMLAESDEEGLDNRVAKHRNDEVVRRGAELNVEEAELVETLRISIEDIGGIAVHSNGSASDHDDLEGAPGQRAEDAEQEKDGENNDGRRVDLGKFPQAEDGELGHADEADTEENAPENGEPAVAEFEKFVVSDHALLSHELGDALETSDGNADKQCKDDEEGKTGQDQVRGFNLGAESDTLDAIDDVAAVVGFDVGTLPEFAGSSSLKHVRTLDQGRGRTLGDLDGLIFQIIEEVCRSSTSRSLVPGHGVLKEAHPDDTHGPLEILGPRLNDGRQPNRGEADNGLGLEVGEERQRVGSDV